jgi:hypothetical protein
MVERRKREVDSRVETVDEKSKIPPSPNVIHKSEFLNIFIFEMLPSLIKSSHIAINRNQC